MVNSNNSRVGFGVQAHLQDRTQRMIVAPDSISSGEGWSSSKKAYDADRIVEELVLRYLRCATTTSGIFCF